KPCFKAFDQSSNPLSKGARPTLARARAGQFPRFPIEVQGFRFQPLPPASPGQREHLRFFRNSRPKTSPKIVLADWLVQFLQPQVGLTPQIENLKTNTLVFLEPSWRIGKNHSR